MDGNNAKIRELPKDHPARKLLEHFEECRYVCVGRDIDFPTQPRIEIEWQSQSDKKRWSFSVFAYIYLSFDLRLDEWINPPENGELSPTEESFLDSFSKARTLLYECEQAAIQKNNAEILKMVDMVRTYFDLHEYAIQARVQLQAE